MNMELLYLLMIGNPKALENLLSSYSTNDNAKLKLLEAMATGDPYNVDVDLDDVGMNETQKLTSTLFFQLGLNLEDFEKDFDNEE